MRHSTFFSRRLLFISRVGDTNNVIKLNDVQSFENTYKSSTNELVNTKAEAIQTRESKCVLPPLCSAATVINSLVLPIDSMNSPLIQIMNKGEY